MAAFWTHPIVLISRDIISEYFVTNSYLQIFRQTIKFEDLLCKLRPILSIQIWITAARMHHCILISKWQFCMEQCLVTFWPTFWYTTTVDVNFRSGVRSTCQQIWIRAFLALHIPVTLKSRFHRSVVFPKYWWAFYTPQNSKANWIDCHRFYPFKFEWRLFERILLFWYQWIS